jgi:MoxR-like ATPase
LSGAHPGGDRRSPTSAAFAGAVLDALADALVGVRSQLERLLLAVFCQGHVLIEDVPGTGKTAAIRALSAATGLSAGRVQGTPDLLPSQVTGVNVVDPSTGRFSFRPGPLFASLVLVDEINRTTPRTQSALLEAMAERQVTVDGDSHTLPQPFVVAATQNPIEHAGTFPLPEAQLDRFLLRIEMGVPARAARRAIIRRHRDRDPVAAIGQVVDPADLTTVWEEVAAVHLSEPVEDYLMDVCDATGEHDDVALGASVRGMLMLERVVRALAALRGRGHVLPDDVQDVAVAVLAHRLVLSTDAHVRGRDSRDVVREIIAKVPVPAAGDD